MEITTVQEAAKFIADTLTPRLLAGEIIPCPICDTNLKIYRRGLNAGMVRGMVVLYKLQLQSVIPGNWVIISKDHMSRDMCLFLHHCEYEKWPWWGLAEKRQERNDMAGIKGGYWRLTQAGIDFLTKGTSIQKYIYELLSTPIGIVDDKPTMVTAQKALHKRFNLPQLLADSLEIVFRSFTEKQDVVRP